MQYVQGFAVVAEILKQWNKHLQAMLIEARRWRRETPWTWLCSMIGRNRGLRESRDTRRSTEARSLLGCRGSSAKKIPFSPTIWDGRILGQVAVKTRLTTVVQWGIGSFRWLVLIVFQIGQFLSIVSKIEQHCT